MASNLVYRLHVSFIRNVIFNIKNKISRCHKDLVWYLKIFNIIYTKGCFGHSCVKMCSIL